jgi:hypothetical protein
MFVSLVYCAESTVRWFVVREKHCWMAADSADKSKRTGRWALLLLHADGRRYQKKKKKATQSTTLLHASY